MTLWIYVKMLKWQKEIVKERGGGIMAQVTKKAYFTHEYYDATSEDLKDQVGSYYIVYY